MVESLCRGLFFGSVQLQLLEREIQLALDSKSFLLKSCEIDIMMEFEHVRRLSI